MSTIDCTFCGDHAVPRATEDVFPLWLAKKLAYVAQQHHPGQQVSYVNYMYEKMADFQDDTLIGESASLKEHVGTVPKAYKLPEVCLACNGGWMSRLEHAARLLLAGILLGNPKQLAPHDQFALATWAVKTSLTYDAARIPRMIPEGLGTRRFFELGYPLPGAQVIIAHDADHLPEGSLAHARKRLDGPHLALPTGVRAVEILVQFDQVVIQTVLNYADDVSTLVEGCLLPVNATYAHQLWPPGPRFTWPSKLSLEGSL